MAALFDQLISDPFKLPVTHGVSWKWQTAFTDIFALPESLLGICSDLRLCVSGREQ